MGARDVPGRDPPVRAEAVHESARTRVTRLFLAGRTVIRKEPLGADAPWRLRHEVAMLERLRGVEGVAQLAAAPRYAGSLVLADAGGTSLAVRSGPLAAGELTGPDRASFTSALEAARDQLTAAAGIYPPGQPGVLHRAVLATLLPSRRPRFSARTVKCATSRYHDHDDHGRPASSAPITAIAVTMHTPPLGTGGPGRSRSKPATPRPPAPPTRRQRVTALMNSQPCRPWTGREPADHLQVKPHNMLIQLAEWARLGFITNTDYGTYALNTPPQPASSTTGADP